MRVGTARHAWVGAVPGDFPRDGRPEVCLLGRSNVGKSSLLNRLLNRHGLARVSKTPGRTQEIHFYLVDDRYYIVDLPGFGYAAVPLAVRRAWGEVVDSYFTQPRPVALGIQLVDVRHGPTDLDVRLADMLVERGIPMALVLTKSDKVSNNQVAVMRRKAPEALGLPADVPVVVTSAAAGTGMKQLTQIVVDALARARAPRDTGGDSR